MGIGATSMALMELRRWGGAHCRYPDLGKVVANRKLAYCWLFSRDSRCHCCFELAARVHVLIIVMPS